MDLLYSCCIILGTNPELIIYTLFDSEFAAFADQMDSVPRHDQPEQITCNKPYVIKKLLAAHVNERDTLQNKIDGWCGHRELQC